MQKRGAKNFGHRVFLFYNTHFNIFCTAITFQRSLCITEHLIQICPAAKSINTQQNLFGAFGNHGAGVVAVWISKISKLILQNWQKFDVNRFLADSLIVNPFTSYCPADFSLQTVEVIGSQ